MLSLLTIRRFLRDTRGNIAIMASVVVGVVLIGVGASLDYSRMSERNGDMQNMADAAVLAAARSGEEELTRLQVIAQTVVDAHNLEALPLSVVIRREEPYLIVDIVSDYSAVMGGFVSSEDRRVSVSAAAPIQTSNPIDMALVLDTTGSMAGANVIAMKQAANALLDELETVEEETKVSLIPFGQYVNVGYKAAALEDRSWIDRSGEGQTVQSCGTNRYGEWVCWDRVTTWQGCMGTHTNDSVARMAPLGLNQAPAAIDESCGSELIPLSQDFTTLRTRITALTTGGTTYLPGGLIWGWRTLSPDAPYTESQSSDSDTVRAMLFMTDGANNRTRGDGRYDPSGPKHRYSADGGSGGLTLTRDLCSNIKADDIRIYVVAYKLPGATSTKSVLSDCASGPDSFFEPESAQELINTFTDIARNINELRLAY